MWSVSHCARECGQRSGNTQRGGDLGGACVDPRNDQIIDELDPADRAAGVDAIAITRRLRAQLRVVVPDRFKGITRPPRPTLHLRPHDSSGRGEVTIAGRRLDSQVKHERVIATVDARLAAGQELSVAGIGRQAAHARAFELEEALADAREELEAVREINRELLAGQNRSRP